MNKLLSLIILIFTIATLTSAQQKELRGTWVAWAGSNYPQKEQIADWMDQLAAGNINVVYVDVWRFGYPYFRSEVFHDLTGKWTDPGLVEGRDILQEMIAEGHRVGIEVDAWFEAGFAASQLENRDLYFSKPQWFAKKQNGSVDFFSNGGLRYNWLSHCNEEAQQFLIDLAQEVAEKYDVDGIEFDRIRYPELDCGYDSATVELYKSEHDGQSPPTSVANAGWIRWRADKLNDFVNRLADSIKSVNPGLTVSNAPLWYGYEQFCQDWPPWINNNYLDLASTQMYFASNSQFEYRLDIELQKVTNDGDLYPGISTVANGEVTPEAELIAMIETTRSRGLQGNVIWYHLNLLNYLDGLKNSVYAESVELPYREAGWRKPAIIINESDSVVKKSTGWVDYNGIPGYDNGCLYASNVDSQWIEYYASIPDEGWYEVYAYIIQFFNATGSATYYIADLKGTQRVQIDQTKPANARWTKLGDVYLNKGDSQRIVWLNNENVGDKFVFADAIMILNTNRVLGPTSHVNNPDNYLENIPDEYILGQNYPNPFNNRTVIPFTLNDSQWVEIQLYNVNGEQVQTLYSGQTRPGENKIRVDLSHMASGIYLYGIHSRNYNQYRKLILLK